MKNNDISIANNVLKLEHEVDMLEKTYKNRHMERVNHSSCSIDARIIYLHLLTNLERIADHISNLKSNDYKTIELEYNLKEKLCIGLIVK